MSGHRPYPAFAQNHRGRRWWDAVPGVGPQDGVRRTAGVFPVLHPDLRDAVSEKSAVRGRHRPAGAHLASDGHPAWDGPGLGTAGADLVPAAERQLGAVERCRPDAGRSVG